MLYATSTTGIVIALLVVCLIWELDERQHKKPKKKWKKKMSWVKKKSK